MPSVTTATSPSTASRGLVRSRRLTLMEHEVQLVDEFGPIGVFADFVAQKLGLDRSPEGRIRKALAASQRRMGRDEGLDV